MAAEGRSRRSARSRTTHSGVPAISSAASPESTSCSATATSPLPPTRRKSPTTAGGDQLRAASSGRPTGRAAPGRRPAAPCRRAGSGCPWRGTAAGCVDRVLDRQVRGAPDDVDGAERGQHRRRDRLGGPRRGWRAGPRRRHRLIGAPAGRSPRRRDPGPTYAARVDPASPLPRLTGSADASVRPARPADAAEIARIQAVTWRTAYRAVLPPGGAGRVGRGRGHRQLARRRHARLPPRGTASWWRSSGQSVVGFAAFGPAELHGGRAAGPGRADDGGLDAPGGAALGTPRPRQPAARRRRRPGAGRRGRPPADVAAGARHASRPASTSRPGGRPTGGPGRWTPAPRRCARSAGTP